VPEKTCTFLQLLLVSNGSRRVPYNLPLRVPNSRASLVLIHVLQMLCISIINRTWCKVRRSRVARSGGSVSHRTRAKQCLLDTGRLALKRGHCSLEHRRDPNTRSVCRKVYEYSQIPGIPCICMYIQYDAYRHIQCSHIPTRASSDTWNFISVLILEVSRLVTASRPVYSTATSI
jgi:hypothetical protein